MRHRLLLLLLVLWIIPSQSNTQTQSSFFQQLRPLITTTNQQILNTRHKLLNLYQSWQKHLTIQSNDRQWLNATAKRYALSNWQPENKQDWLTLINRVDILPESLVLAQAAHESAFGQSRFATQGHNLFGQWCYQPGCGIIPQQRPAGKHYEVQRFPNYMTALKAYFHNLNTQAAYQSLRSLRASLRTLGKPLCGTAIAAGLEQYSSQRQQYVTAIQRMIQRFKLEKSNACSS